MKYDSYTEAIRLFDFLFEKKKIKPKVKISSDNIGAVVSRVGESGHGAFYAVVMLSAISKTRIVIDPELIGESELERENCVFEFLNNRDVFAFGIMKISLFQ